MSDSILDSIKKIFENMDFTQGLGGLGLIAILIFANWGKIKEWWNSRKSSSTSTGEEDSDVEDFKAWRRLRARFERNKCHDGIQAMDTALTHFSHKEEE